MSIKVLKAYMKACNTTGEVPTFEGINRFKEYYKVILSTLA